MTRRGVLTALALAIALIGVLPGAASAGPCRIESGLDDLSEGRTDPKLGFRRASDYKVLFLFVDFADGPGDPAVPGQLTDEVGPPVSEYYAGASYGRAKFQVSAVREWLRMPRPASFYELEESVTHAEYRRYLKDVVAVADAKIDFSTYDSVQVFNPAGVGMTRGHAFIESPGGGIKTSETELRFAAGTSDQADRADLATTIVHELGHNVGLPDLYDVGGSFEPGAGKDLFRFSGLWDVMSMTTRVSRMFAWHRLKLGWLRSSEVRCIAKGSATATLAPVDETSGVRALVARVSGSRAWVAEVRPPGPSEWGCGAGVLLYRVDANVVTGDGPIRVAIKKRAPSQYCTSLATAPFAKRGYTTSDGVRMDVLGASGTGYVVRLRLPKGIRVFETPPPPDSDLTNVLP